jgi:hypothetical protein
MNTATDEGSVAHAKGSRCGIEITTVRLEVPA